MDLGRVNGWFVGNFLCAALSLHAQNLLVNGNFEAGGGSFAGWDISHSITESNYYSPTIASDGINDGHFARFTFEPDGEADILSQTISTIPGVVYDIAFSAEDGDGHNFETDFSFGDFSADLEPAFEISPGQWYAGWTNFYFAVTATSGQTELAFTISADTGSEFGVDDVSVTADPVPEPDSNALILLDLTGIAIAKCFKPLRHFFGRIGVRQA